MVFEGTCGKPSRHYWKTVKWKLKFGMWCGRVGDYRASNRRTWYVLNTMLVVTRGKEGRGCYTYKPGTKAAFLEMILFNQKTKEDEE